MFCGREREKEREDELLFFLEKKKPISKKKKEKQLSLSTHPSVPGQPLPQRPRPEHEEQRHRGPVRPLFGDQRRGGPPQEGRQRRHRRERRHRAGEHELLRLLHRHDGGDEKGLVADFRDEDHAPGLEEALLWDWWESWRWCGLVF